MPCTLTMAGRTTMIASKLSRSCVVRPLSRTVPLQRAMRPAYATDESRTAANMKEAAKNTTDFVKDTADLVKENVIDLAGGAKSSVGGAVSGAIETVEHTLGDANKDLKEVAGSAEKNLHKAGDKVSGFASDVKTDIKEAVRKM